MRRSYLGRRHRSLAVLPPWSFCQRASLATTPLSKDVSGYDTVLCQSAEYLLFYYHSTNHEGLEGYNHLILVIAVALCVATAIAGALSPESLAMDLTSGVCITLQGLWFYQTAFTLYGPMMPQDCYLDDDNDIKCHSNESEVRGELLANFQLVFLTFLYVLGCYGIAAVRYGHPDLRTFHASALVSQEGDRNGEVVAA